jgi:hypothetical protein
MRLKSFGVAKRFSGDFGEANKGMETFILRDLGDRWKGNPLIAAFVPEQDSSASAILQEKDRMRMNCLIETT